MNVRKYRWSKHYESAEEELLGYLAAKGITAKRWTADEMEVLKPLTEPVDQHIWCAEGSIIYTIAGQRYSIQPGDCLEIPANTPQQAVAGISGVVCYQYLQPLEAFQA